MKNVVGNPARGESFYQREREIQKIIDRIVNGNNLQIAAPRRIGKTSILYYLLDNKLGNNIYVYVDTEAIDDEAEYYKKLLKEIVKSDAIKSSGWFTSLWNKGNKFFSKIKSVKLFGHQVDFDEDEKAADYKSDIENLLAGLEFEDNKRLILLIDEFPQTVQNIIDSPNGGAMAAIHFLQSNREIRLNPDILNKVTFIYTGSIGLNHTVSSIDGMAFINDLNSVEVEPLKDSEAGELVDELFRQKALVIDQSAKDYLFKKIQWLIPFHIQLITQELFTICNSEETVVPETIDKAFENLVASRNNNHFEHYASRLKKQFKGNLYAYADELLQTIAKEDTIDKAAAFNLAVKHKVEADWRKVLEILMYDGYINNTGFAQVYKFNSPVVKLWWLKFICM